MSKSVTISWLTHNAFFFPISHKTSNWQWKFKDNFINIYYEEHVKESPEPSQNILMMPTISDVSTVEEWRLVAGDIAQRNGSVNWKATIVDWPGLGYSDRPKIDYNADVLEKFLVDFINSPNSPVKQPGTCGGHYILQYLCSSELYFCNIILVIIFYFSCNYYPCLFKNIYI